MTNHTSDGKSDMEPVVRARQPFAALRVCVGTEGGPQQPR